MEPRMIPVEHSNGSNSSHHFQNHFTSETNLSEMNNNARFPTHGYEIHSSSRRQTPSSAQESSHSQVVQSHYDYGTNSKILQEEEQHAKKQTTTTTTTTMQQPSYMLTQVEEEEVPFGGQRLDVFQPINGPAGYMKQTSVELENNPNSYTIKVEHHPKNEKFNWSNLDVYLHIFLTFYFGHFAAMLFFDGILRNIANLYVMEHSAGSIFLYILHIVFSIGFLAFTIWFMTICWRWWRHKSLLPSDGAAEYTQRPLRPRAKQATAHGLVFVSACILILGFFVFLAIGCIDLAYKKQQVSNSDFFKQYNESLYLADMIVFIFRLVFWLVGIVATLLLSREILYKYCCPSKQIRINKERPTTVYEVQN